MHQSHFQWTSKRLNRIRVFVGKTIHSLIWLNCIECSLVATLVALVCILRVPKLFGCSHFEDQFNLVVCISTDSSRRALAACGLHLVGSRYGHLAAMATYRPHYVQHHRIRKGEWNLYHTLTIDIFQQVLGGRMLFFGRWGNLQHSSPKTHPPSHTPTHHHFDWFG